MTSQESRVWLITGAGHGLSGAVEEVTERAARAIFETNFFGAEMGDPRKVAEGVLTLVNSEEKPLRLLLGDGEFDTMQAVYQGRLEEWKAWEAVSRAAG